MWAHKIGPEVGLDQIIKYLARSRYGLDLGPVNFSLTEPNPGFKFINILTFVMCFQSFNLINVPYLPIYQKDCNVFLKR